MRRRKDRVMNRGLGPDQGSASVESGGTRSRTQGPLGLLLFLPGPAEQDRKESSQRKTSLPYQLRSWCTVEQETQARLSTWDINLPQTHVRVCLLMRPKTHWELSAIKISVTGLLLRGQKLKFFSARELLNAIVCQENGRTCWVGREALGNSCGHCQAARSAASHERHLVFFRKA